MRIKIGESEGERLNMNNVKVINDKGFAQPTMLISVECYTQIIEQIGYLKGRNMELEKQLNKEQVLEIPIECDEVQYYDNKPHNMTKLTMKNFLEREIKRLEGLKKDSCREEMLRINGKIEGLEYAINKLFDYKIKGGIQMFKLRKRLKEIDDIQNELKNKLLTEEKLYKFYLERKIDEINARLKHNLSYSIEHNTESIRADGWRFFDMSWTISVKIKISNIEIKKFTYVTHSNITKKDIYKAILRYINSKPISYFIKLDKKIEDLEKHNIELDKKKLNLEEELKKII